MDDWIRVSGIGDADLPDRVKIDLITVAMYELAVAQMLMLIHGRERGARLYAERGGQVRFTASGEPCLPVAAAPWAGVFSRPPDEVRP